MKFNYSNPFIKKIAYKLLPCVDYLKLYLGNSGIAIHGSYYTTNIGDRAIAIVLKNELKKKGYRSITVSRFCIHPPQRTIVVGGGGVIHNLYPGNLDLRTSFIKPGKNVIYIGVGCPGFHQPDTGDMQKISRLTMARYISVRDQGSYDNLTAVADVHPEILACPAWLMNRYLHTGDVSLRNFIFRLYYNHKFRIRRTVLPQRNKPRIGVVVNGHFNLKYLTDVKAMLRDLAADFSLVYIPFVGEDLEFFRKELSDLNMVCLKLGGPVETYKAVAAMDKMIAMRYHSVIFAVLAQKPTLVLAYSQKVISLAADLNLKFTNLVDDRPKKFRFNEKYDEKLILKKIAEAQKQTDRIIENL